MSSIAIITCPFCEDFQWELDLASFDGTWNLSDELCDCGARIFPYWENIGRTPYMRVQAKKTSEWPRNCDVVWPGNEEDT